MVFSYHCWLIWLYHDSGIENRISLFILLPENTFLYMGGATEHFNDRFTSSKERTIDIRKLQCEVGERVKNSSLFLGGIKPPGLRGW